MEAGVDTAQHSAAQIVSDDNYNQFENASRYAVESF